MPLDLLLGRKPGDILALHWPHHWDARRASTRRLSNRMHRTVTSGEWQPSVFLSGDVAEKIAAIKQQLGPDLNVWGSG